LLAGCGNSNKSAASSSSSSVTKETTSQLNKKYTTKIAEHAQEGKLTSEEKKILKAHDKIQEQKLDKTKARFNGKTAVFPNRGTVEILNVAKVPTYDDDEKQTDQKAVVVITKITNTSKKTLSTDEIQTGNIGVTNLGLVAYQNSGSTKENLSDDYELNDSNALYTDDTNSLTKKDLSFEKPSILPGKSVTVLYEAFGLANKTNPITFKIHDGTGESNADDVLSSKDTVKIPMSEVKDSTLSDLLK